MEIVAPIGGREIGSEEVITGGGGGGGDWRSETGLWQFIHYPPFCPEAGLWQLSSFSPSMVNVTLTIYRGGLLDKPGTQEVQHMSIHRVVVVVVVVVAAVVRGGGAIVM